MTGHSHVPLRIADYLSTSAILMDIIILILFPVEYLLQKLHEQLPCWLSCYLSSDILESPMHIETEMPISVVALLTLIPGG